VKTLETSLICIRTFSIVTTAHLTVFWKQSAFVFRWKVVKVCVQSQWRKSWYVLVIFHKLNNVKRLYGTCKDAVFLFFDSAEGGGSKLLRNVTVRKVSCYRGLEASVMDWFSSSSSSKMHVSARGQRGLIRELCSTYRSRYIVDIT
jgi:hypothetical protein